MRITGKDVFALFFVGAAYFQFYSIAKLEAKPSVNNEIESSIELPVMVNESIISKEKAIERAIEKTPIVNTYRLSEVGKDFIKSHETCVLKAYNDPDPKRRSVGWGHQIQPGEKLETITQEKADELFEKDIEWVNDAINRLIAQNDSRFIYSQGFIDGLGSLIYNCGERGVTRTEFFSHWQKCRYDKTSETGINESDWRYTLAFVKTARISAPGHTIRRNNEYKLMLN